MAAAALRCLVGMLLLLAFYLAKRSRSAAEAQPKRSRSAAPQGVVQANTEGNFLVGQALRLVRYGVVGFAQ